MTLSIIVTFFFRLINFALLVALMVYVYKKYLYILLLKGVQEEQHALSTLEREEHDTKQKRVVLSTQLHDDQQLIVILKKKIAAWALVEREQRHAREAYKVIHSKNLQEKAHVKQILITEYMIEKEAMPLIVTQARTQLIAHYQDNKESDRYIECIVDTLNQEGTVHECR